MARFVSDRALILFNLIAPSRPDSVFQSHTFCLLRAYFHAIEITLQNRWPGHYVMTVFILARGLPLILVLIADHVEIYPAIFTFSLETIAHVGRPWPDTQE